MPEWLATSLGFLLMLWPVWVALAVTYVAYRVERRQDATWEDAPTRPGGLG